MGACSAVDGAGISMTVTPSSLCMPARGSANTNSLPPRAHLLKIGFELLEQLIVGRHRDHRHVFVDQRQGTMLELRRGVAFCVDVRDFLELQRTLQGNGMQR